MDLTSEEAINALHDQRAQYAKEQCVRAIEAYAQSMQQLLNAQVRRRYMNKENGVGVRSDEGRAKNESLTSVRKGVMSEEFVRSEVRREKWEVK